MRLNKGKCEYIGMFGNAQVKLKNGTPVKQEDHAGYLGSKITQKADGQTEIISITSKVMNTIGRLNFFWKKTNASLRWKLLIYNAVIVSQIRMGLMSCTSHKRSTKN